MIKTTGPTGRRGASLLISLLCLMIVSLLLAAIMQVLALGSLATPVKRHQQQALHMAQAGVELAARRIRERPDYTGETWTISAAELGGPSDEVQGRVTIAVDRTQIRVVAEYPADVTRQSRISRVVTRNDDAISGENSK